MNGNLTCRRQTNNRHQFHQKSGRRGLYVRWCWCSMLPSPTIYTYTSTRTTYGSLANSGLAPIYTYSSPCTTLGPVATQHNNDLAPIEPVPSKHQTSCKCRSTAREARCGSALTARLVLT